MIIRKNMRLSHKPVIPCDLLGNEVFYEVSPLPAEIVHNILSAAGGRDIGKNLKINKNIIVAVLKKR